MSTPFQFTEWRFEASDGRLENTTTGADVTLRPQVGRLLAIFLTRPGEVIDRETLYREVWDDGVVVDFEAGLAALLRELRKNLSEVGADPACIETIPRRGYRFLSGTSPVPAKRKPPVLALVGTALIVVVLTVALVALWVGKEEPLYDPPEMTLAILPFEGFGAGSPHHLDILLPDAILARLWRVELGGLVLIGRASLRPYTDRDDVALAVSEDLGVNLLMEGVVTNDGGAWTVTARLLHMPAGRVLWSQTVEWLEADALPVSATADRLIHGFQESFREISDRFHGSEVPGG